MLFDDDVELPLEQVDLPLRELGLALLEPLLRHPLLALLVVQLRLQAAQLLRKDGMSCSI